MTDIPIPAIVVQSPSTFEDAIHSVITRWKDPNLTVRYIPQNKWSIMGTFEWMEFELLTATTFKITRFLPRECSLRCTFRNKG